MNNKTGNNWDTLYKKEAPKLIGVCRRYVGNNSVAEDIVQDSFLAAIEKAEQFKGNGSIEAWIYRIVVNSTLQYLNNNKIVQIPIDRISDLTEPAANNESTGSMRKTIENADFSIEDMLAALDLLPEHHRLVFNLYVMDGYKHKNIAKILNISTGTSKSHLARARKKLIQILSSRVDYRKKKRRAIVFWLFSGSDSYIDKLYRKQFRDFEIQPTKTFVANGDVMPLYKNNFTLFNTPLFFIGAGSAIALIIFFTNDMNRTPPILVEPVTINNSVEEISIVIEEPETDFQETEDEGHHDSVVNIKPDTVRKIIRKPVYIKKTVVIKDTIR